MEHGLRLRIVAAVGAIALLVLGACRESEQGRRLDSSKGAYAGAPDQELDSETREALALRAEHQRF